jgi:hypothetical protein
MADTETPAALVRGFLASLMKAALIADDGKGLAWRQDAARRHEAICRRAGEMADLKLDGLWWLAVGDAETPELREQADRIEYGQPKVCPFALAELIAPDFDIDRAVQHLRETAATG